MDSTKHKDRMIRYVNTNFRVSFEQTVHENSTCLTSRLQSPNLSPKLPRQSFESCNYVV